VERLPSEYDSTNTGSSRPWRRIVSLVWLLFVLGLVALFVVSRHHELRDIGHVLASADRRWIMVAGVLELVILVLIGRTYQTILLSLGHQISLRSITSCYLRGLAVGTVIPFGGPAAMVVFIRALSQVGVPANDAVFASTLSSLSGFASFLLVLAPLMLTLALTGHLSSLVVGATLALAVLFLLAVCAVVIPLRWKRLPGWIPRYMPGWITRFLMQARDHQVGVADLRRPFVYSLAVDLCGAAMLYAALLSVGERSGILAAFAGYQVEMLFNVITPLFQGIGIADLSIAVALNELGVHLSEAAAATLVYRLWDLWVPLLAGALVYLFTRRGSDAR